MQRLFMVVVGLSVACGSVSGDGKQDAAVKQPDAAVDGRGVDASTCAATPANLAARWRGESNTNDDSGNAYNGTAIGSLAYAPGKHGMAFLMNGSTTEVQVNDGDALWPAASVSVEAWVKTATAPGQLVMKYQCAGSCPTNSYAYYSLRIDDNGNPVFELRSDATANGNNVTDTVHHVSDGNWHYLVGVRDVPGSQLLLYVDGAVAGTMTLPAENLGAMTNTDSETDYVTLGAGTIGGTSTITAPLSGALDDVAIYKSALTPAQVAAIYAAPDGECN